MKTSAIYLDAIDEYLGGMGLVSSGRDVISRSGGATMVRGNDAIKFEWESAKVWVCVDIGACEASVIVVNHAGRVVPLTRGFDLADPGSFVAIYRHLESLKSGEA